MFIDVASLLSPLFKKLGFSPNMITGINIYFSILCIYHLYLQNYNYAVIYFKLLHLMDFMHENIIWKLSLVIY